MASNTMKNFTIILTLGLLTISAFFIRLENFQNADKRSVDEIVYFRMAQQINAQGLDGYQTIPYGDKLKAGGRPLPEYFFQPLFKHPPVFTLLNAFVLKIFGAKLSSAAHISLLAGALMIPLCYWLGLTIYGQGVGLLAAFLMWMDPVTMISSQKIWMDTTLACFGLLSIACLIWGIKKNSNTFYILSGLAGGLAVNTKYPGILIPFSILGFTCLYRRDLFRNPYFVLGLILPLLSLIPWAWWNYLIYGQDVFPMQSTLHGELKGLFPRIFLLKPLFLLFYLVLLAGIYFLIRLKKKSPPQNNTTFLPFQAFSLVLAIFFLIYFLRDSIGNSIQWNYLPKVSWRGGMFGGEPPSFYFRQLLEFFPVYAFAFIALLMYHPNEKKETAILRISAVLILVFYILHGNYQSRYILAAIPFLIIMAAHTIIQINQIISKIPQLFPRALLRSLFFLFITLLCLKTHHLNQILSTPHNFCYF